MKFTFKTGQQPLPGYTIKRGIGLGGFGEVYFAVSDAGREVALKVIQGYESPGYIGESLIEYMDSKHKVETMVGFTALDGRAVAADSPRALGPAGKRRSLRRAGPETRRSGRDRCRVQRDHQPSNHAG